MSNKLHKNIQKILKETKEESLFLPLLCKDDVAYYEGTSFGFTIEFYNIVNDNMDTTCIVTSNAKSFFGEEYNHHLDILINTIETILEIHVLNGIDIMNENYKKGIKETIFRGMAELIV